MQPWEPIEEPVVTKVGWRTIVKKTFKDPNGERLETFIKDPIGVKCVAVIALTPQNKVVVNEMFRPGPEKVMFELPGGGVSDNEDLAEAALRELQEETGYKSENIRYLGKTYKDAWGNAESHYFIAHNCIREVEQELDKEEFIAPHEISISQLIKNSRNALMTDSDAVLLAYEELMAIEKGETT